jgi:hypothetical protein
MEINTLTAVVKQITKNGHLKTISEQAPRSKHRNAIETPVIIWTALNSML